MNAQKKKMIRIAIDLSEPMVDVVAALQKRLPTPPSPPTIWRWRTRGTNGVMLPARRCGRYWMTTERAIDEFIRLQNTDPEDTDDTLDDESDIDEQLKAAGLLK